MSKLRIKHNEKDVVDVMETITFLVVFLFLSFVISFVCVNFFNIIIEILFMMNDTNINTNYSLILKIVGISGLFFTTVSWTLILSDAPKKKIIIHEKIEAKNARTK